MAHETTACPLQLIDFLISDGNPGGGEEHDNLQGVEVVHVAGRPGGDPALPPPDGITPAGGNGQGGVAGNVADAPAPAAPALMALRQQVLATQQAIVECPACV